jgi:hypothetical protein
MNTMNPLSNALPVLAFFPIIGVCIKWSMDAWSKTSKTSNIYAISSIVQYSLMTMYLVLAIIFIGRFLFSNSNNPTVITWDLKWFLGTLLVLLFAYVGIITLYSLYYPTLQYGYITPSISESINNYIMFPLWILILYNMYTYIDCYKNNTCKTNISYLTFTIMGFTLMHIYLIVNSFRIVQRWPTDDIYFAPT